MSVPSVEGVVVAVVLDDVTDALVGVIDELARLDPLRLADGETIEALHRQLERLGAVTTRAVAGFDAGRSWEDDGARTASSWVSWRCHVPLASARRRVQLGRALRHMPAVDAAWLAGDIGIAHVGVLASARTPATAEYFERDEAMLVGQAGDLRYHHFVRTLAYWCQRADPDGTEKSAQARHEERSLRLSATFGGSWALNGLFDPINGTIVADVLNKLEDELFEADWAEARERVGDGVRVSDLARTPTQRGADAMVEMARRAMATPAGSRLPEPLFTVLVGYETFAGRICELAKGTVVAPGALVGWLERAWVERVVFDGPSRVSDVGARQRLFTGATRRGVEVRDRECFHESCAAPAPDCEIDHVVPWSEGGPTTQANGRVACGFHNRERHKPRPPPAAPA